MLTNYVIDFSDKNGNLVVFDIDQFSFAEMAEIGLDGKKDLLELHMKSGKSLKIICDMSDFIIWLDGLRENRDGSVESAPKEKEAEVDKKGLVVKAAIFHRHDGRWCTTEIIRIPEMDENAPFYEIFPKAYESFKFKMTNDLSKFIVIICTLDGLHERAIPLEVSKYDFLPEIAKEETMAFHKKGDVDLVSVRCSCGGEIRKDGKCKQCGKTYEAEDLEQKKEASDEAKNNSNG